MLNGIYFLGSIIAVLIVFVWYIRNDKVPADKPTTGLLAMKLPGDNPQAKTKKKKSRWRREGDGH